MYIKNSLSDKYVVVTPSAYIYISIDKNLKNDNLTNLTEYDKDLLNRSKFVEENDFNLDKIILNNYTCCDYKIYKMVDKNINGWTYKNLPDINCNCSKKKIMR
ncbi:unknown similar to AMEV242 [Mythimna separata entomopoxvirus 'L']|uniref:Uncharacterized protein n=1 Tax=Mythimna separata entomopoxvirus 'L' TaxID=1293572 RepID=A0A916KQF6_9POXV|nr:unknown similar to AMEV242 [Mythimna separata entomopoxvirus 'L']CCU56467.1 unknown similar to AMEV242 [Mythimna separata entomopoxvirus 'L']